MARQYTKSVARFTEQGYNDKRDAIIMLRNLTPSVPFSKIASIVGLGESTTWHVYKMTWEDHRAYLDEKNEAKKEAAERKRVAEAAESILDEKPKNTPETQLDRIETKLDLLLGKVTEKKGRRIF